LRQREEALVIALQNVAEFWNAATRPAVKDVARNVRDGLVTGSAL